MSKIKKKSTKSSWQWWTEKELTEEARDIVMARPRSMGTSRTQIKLEIEIEKKRLAKEWEEEAKKKLKTKRKLPKQHSRPRSYDDDYNNFVDWAYGE